MNRMQTDDSGVGSQEFIGRFSIETFAVAQPLGNAPAPVVFDQPPFPDADTNPPFEPLHTFHLGLWFGSPDDAANAGCPAAVTHNAGIQVLNTSNSPTTKARCGRWDPHPHPRRVSTGRPVSG